MNQQDNISDTRIQLANKIMINSNEMHITIAEVGARIIDEGQALGEAAEIFHNLPQAKVIAFEPDQGCCDQINNLPDHFAANIQAYPYALGKEKKQQTLYITNHGMCSSLYKPNETFMQHFTGLEVAYLKEELPVDVISLDEFMKVESIDAIDFIKIDVQGAELDVFKGGESALNDVIGICTEVEFAELYEGQPLFADVDQFLRQHGFQLHHFIGLGSRSLKGCELPHIPQHLWSDALYLPSFERIDSFSSSKLIKLAVMASLYEVYDLAAYALERYDSKNNTHLIEVFHSFFNVNQGLTMNKTSHSETLSLPIQGGVKIVVPNNLSLMTPYVLTEQQDWFEDEIKFVRKLIKPNSKILDIGANYGCYTMTLANLTGSKGHVWAFEPASTTASFLSKSIKENGFKNITLIQAALSNQVGTAKLSLDDNSELNSISVQSNSGNSESVTLKKLDDCIKSYQWHHISFIKMDAEGEEIHILEGGQAFFSQFSPLVMFELKHGDQINEGLIEKFIAMNYQTYVLIPGLDILAPFDHSEEPDTYLLNLFCCKDDTAKNLVQENILVESINEQGILPSHDWAEIIKSYPYVNRFNEAWQSTIKNNPEPSWNTYEQVLNHYASAHLATSPTKKLAHLQQAFMTLVSLLDVHATIPRLLTLIRIATELGKRAVAVQLLNQVSEHLIQEGGCTLNEPFLPISSLAETLDPEDNAANWCLAIILAEKEKKQAFSSYFLGKTSQESIEHFCKLGFQDDEMQRRLQLIQQRFSS